jgi:hypothetical protein
MKKGIGKIKINIETIPHNQHRYETVGDWWRDKKGVLQIRVSDMGDHRYEFLVVLHELIETILCEHRGIKEEVVSAFDKQYETEREEGKHGESDEPGFDTKAPYVREHTMASGVEMIIGQELGVDWNTYDKTVMSL